MENDKIAIIVNGASGSGTGAKILEGLRSSPVQGLSLFEIKELVTLDLAPYSHILVCGGDGTITSVIARMVANHVSGMVIPVPLGTANDLARELGVARVRHIGGVFTALDRIPKLTTTKLSVWEARWGIEDDQRLIFTNYLSLGFDAQVVKEFSRWRSSLAGKRSSVLRNRFQYGICGVKNLGHRLPFLTISSNGSAVSMQGGLSLLFANIQSIMGFGRTHRSCNFSDDLLEAIAFPTVLSFLRLMPPLDLVFGQPELLGRKDRWTLSGELGNVAIQTDGETVILNEVDELIIQKIGAVKIGSWKKFEVARDQ